MSAPGTVGRDRQARRNGGMQVADGRALLPYQIL